MKLLRVINSLCVAFICALVVNLYCMVAEIYPGEPEYPTHAHITLYLDRHFEDYEVDAIVQAAWEWTVATDHRIEYDIVKLPTKEQMRRNNVVFIYKRSPDDPVIILRDLVEHNKTLGLYEGGHLPSISIIADRLDMDIYKEIVLHELGHSLGIKHLESESDMDALMYPYASIALPDGTIIPTGSDHITYKDLVAFCKLYHCDADKLKY